ncbi:hypothetical protein ACFFTM_09355 [Pseudoduganella plicata]|nr:hypothetical protein [Pseudoduganella plicata]
MHILVPVNRSTTQPFRNALPAGPQAATGSTHDAQAIATMEVQ